MNVWDFINKNFLKEIFDCTDSCLGQEILRRLSMSGKTGNFDDSELEDIMREMEELEGADFDSRFESKRPSKLEDVIGKGLSDLGQVASTATQGEVSPISAVSAFVQKKTGPSSPRTLPSSRSSGPMTMGLSISGQMELQLSFNSSGHEVKITIMEGKGLEIEMEGGAKFSVPFRDLEEKVA